MNIRIIKKFALKAIRKRLLTHLICLHLGILNISFLTQANSSKRLRICFLGTVATVFIDVFPLHNRKGFQDVIQLFFSKPYRWA